MKNLFRNALICVIVIVFGFIVFTSAQESNQQPTNTPSSNQQQIAQPKIETKTETETEVIPFDSKEQNDTTILKGQTKVVQEGKDGVRTRTFSAIYTDGKKTSFNQIKEEVTTQPVSKIVAIGTKNPAPVVTAPTLSNDNYYENSAGDSIHSPAYSNSAPAGASAICGDGTYSFSASRRGTCSHHGGVAQWL